MEEIYKEPEEYTQSLLSEKYTVEQLETIQKLIMETDSFSQVNSILADLTTNFKINPTNNRFTTYTMEDIIKYRLKKIQQQRELEEENKILEEQIKNRK